MTQVTEQNSITIGTTLLNYLTEIFMQAFDDLGFDKRFANIQVSARPELGQFQCNGAMPLAKIQKKAPFEIAEVIGAQVSRHVALSKVEVVKPGFINLTLCDDFLAKWNNQVLQDKRLGCAKKEKPTKVMMDFGGPNVAKPLHIGHIRSPLIGDCLQRVYRFLGDEVLSDVHLGDWGTQMGMLIEEVKKMHPDLPYFEEDSQDEYPKSSPVTVDDLSEIYPRASSRCKSDAVEMEKARLATAQLQQGRRGYRALWRHFVNVSIAALKKDYADLGIHFDLWKGESDVQNLIDVMVEKALENGAATVDEGATIIAVAKDAEDKTPPLILLKSDGAVMYGTTDLATIQERVNEFDAQKIIYVVDKRQSLHFKQVFLAAKKANIVKDTELVHVGFGTLNGKDGKPFKTRSGGVMRLSTLIDEARSRASIRNQEQFSEHEQVDIINKVALATVKFADLANVYTSDYIFDLDKFSQYEGKTGPYLLYSAVRIKSILRKIEDKQLLQGLIQASSNDAERNLQLVLTQLPLALQKTYDKCEPHHLCEYAYQLSVHFNKFYNESPIHGEENAQLKRSRIQLCQLTLKQLIFVLGLLGIEIPERM